MDNRFCYSNSNHLVDNSGLQTQFPLNANLGPNNGIGLTNNSFQFASSRTIGLNQNGRMTHRIGHSSSPLVHGHLGLMAQRVTEVRRTTFLPYRAHVRSLIGYSPTQISRPSLSLADVMRVAEVVSTTSFLTPTSHRILNISSNNFPLDRIASLCNPQINTRLSQSSAFKDLYIQYLRQRQRSVNITDFDDPPEQGVAPPARVSSAYNLGSRNQNPWGNWHRDLNLKPKFYGFGEPNRNCVLESAEGAANCDQIGLPDHGYDCKEYDGKTHSLPTRKYGPYTCPKCRGVFTTSQSFAAHVSSHYKYETREERERRLAAKYRKKNLRLIQSRQGLTAMPKSVNAFTRARKIAFRNQGIEDIRSKINDYVKELVQDVPTPEYLMPRV